MTLLGLFYVTTETIGVQKNGKGYVPVAEYIRKLVIILSQNIISMCKNIDFRVILVQQFKLEHNRNESSS